MVPFAGYELPVLYKGTENGGVMKEHLWCRTEGKCSLFDVSHMGQVSYFYAHVIDLLITSFMTNQLFIIHSNK